ncbi:MAG: DUF1643 domain-containing protein [Caldilineaceae bacterium]
MGHSRSFPHSAIPRRLFRHILECSLSACQRYRYRLQVALSPAWDSLPTLTIILKNPSTADAQRGDPTTGKVETWARHHGFAAVTYLNLFALRSPYPKALNSVDYDEALGAANDQTIQDELRHTQKLVIAWGNPNGIEAVRYQRRTTEVTRLLHASQKTTYTVGSHTLLGYPRHGLQWRKEMGIMRLGD